MRIRLTLDITRRTKPANDELHFEHRDTDSVTEATYGGDPAEHRLGFTPAPTGGEG